MSQLLEFSRPRGGRQRTKDREEVGTATPHLPLGNFSCGGAPRQAASTEFMGRDFLMGRASAVGPIMPTGWADGRWPEHRACCILRLEARLALTAVYNAQGGQWVGPVLAEGAF